MHSYNLVREILKTLFLVFERALKLTLKQAQESYTGLSGTAAYIKKSLRLVSHSGYPKLLLFGRGAD